MLKLITGYMRTPTQDLVDEHSGIILMLSIMGVIVRKLRSGQSVEKEHLYKIVEFLKSFVDKCHHGKEEGILFPELQKDSSNDGMINELLHEHQTGRDFVKIIAQSSERYIPGNLDALQIASASEAYIKLLTQHIKKENTLLFPIADRELPVILQEQLNERFEELERDVIGEGKHEEYHGWLKELENEYLHQGD